MEVNARDVGGAPTAGKLGSSRWWFAGLEKTREAADFGIHSMQSSFGILPTLANHALTCEDKCKFL